MAIERQGRGAWPKDGRGGTLGLSKYAHGPYYRVGDNDWNSPGIHAILRFLDGQPIPFDEYAVHLGVKAIQRLLNDCAGIKSDIKVDGIFGKSTEASVKELQKLGSIKQDGIVGAKTMKTLLLLPIIQRANQSHVSWEAVWGILHFEGGWDPGAVGYIDSNDLGLSQVNTKAHPHVTVEQAYDPYWAIDFIINYLENARTYLGDNIVDIVVSYNLGIGGTRQWIAAGRPDEWTPPWSTLKRKPAEYAAKILGAHNL